MISFQTIGHCGISVPSWRPLKSKRLLVSSIEPLTIAHTSRRTTFCLNAPLQFDLCKNSQSLQVVFLYKAMIDLLIAKFSGHLVFTLLRFSVSRDPTDHTLLLKPHSIGSLSLVILSPFQLHHLLLGH